jgi:integrase
MVNTGLRPDEAMRLEFRDVSIVDGRTPKEAFLEISVRGKRGVGYCKSMPGAVLPFKRLAARKRPVIMGRAQPLLDGAEALVDGPKTRIPGDRDRLFPNQYREMFNIVLGELDLKFDREGQRRSAYSLRHTYISMRLMEGADIYQIAKNCRTSVEMIEKYYASHIKDMIDETSVNVMKSRTRTAGRAPKRGVNTKRAKRPRKFGHPRRG